MRWVDARHPGFEGDRSSTAVTLVPVAVPDYWRDSVDAPATDPRALAFDALPTAAWIITLDGTIEICNAAAEALGGFSAQSLIGQPWWWFLEEGARAETGSEWRRFSLRAAAGSRPVLVRSLPLPAGDAPTRLLLLLEPPETVEAVAGRDSAFLVNAVAHELRSLLLSFNLSLGGLSDLTSALQMDERKLVSTLERSGVHLQTLLENMLDAASIGASEFHIRPTIRDLTEVVEEAALVVTPLLGPRALRIAIDLPREPLQALIDDQHLRQALVNLLHNSIKYGPARETITVRARQNGDWVRVEVQDNGGNIPLEEQALLFERFYRGCATGTGQGSGLGLAIAKEIVRAHGGEIGVVSDSSRGTVFWFTIPAA